MKKVQIKKKRTGRQDRNKMGKVMKEKCRKVYGYKKDGKNNDENEKRKHQLFEF